MPQHGKEHVLGVSGRGKVNCSLLFSFLLMQNPTGLVISRYAQILIPDIHLHRQKSYKYKREGWGGGRGNGQGQELGANSCCDVLLLPL